MSVPSVGILGGGQLGRMLALAGVPLGVRCLVVEPVADPPVAAVAEVVAAPYDDRRALEQLARRCDVVTVELEGVPAEALAWLAERVPVHPSPLAVAVAQDRLVEKRRFGALGITTAPYTPWPPETETAAVPAGEVLVKTRRGGFDGRGQRDAAGRYELAVAVEALGGRDLVVEGRVEFDRELAVVAARAADGELVTWPVVETVHEGGILRLARPDTPAARARRREAHELVARLAEDLGYVGVLAVELFDTAGGLVANEWAPRVHNSGHWTIEGAVTSQFEQHLRAVLGLPLGSPAPLGWSGMVNLIGAAPPLADLLAQPGAHVHLYGKATRPGRKLGHVTLVDADRERRDARCAAIERLVRASGEGA